MKGFKVEVSLPGVAKALFDSEVKKPTEPPEPDSNPEVEAINQELRQKYHDEHPTMKEFLEDLGGEKDDTTE